MNTAGTGRHVIIVGAGLGGALMACFLARRGHRVELFERRPDPRRAGFAGGRSINLALSTRGIHALQQVDLAERVLADAVPMRGRMMHLIDGPLTFQAYSKNPDEAINSVSRGGLNLTLIEAALAHANVSARFGCRCTNVDLTDGTATFVDDATDEQFTAKGDLLIGSDGAFSAVRNAMQRTPGFNYAQDYLEHGYKELTIPANAQGGFAMQKEALHIWPRGGSMMIALPNQDGSFTCTCFWPNSGPRGFDRLTDAASVTAFFEQVFPDAVPLMPTLTEDYLNNPVGSLITIRCAPWHTGDHVVLLGDSAHAIVPFFGQGMNAAFEDCVVLDHCLANHDDWSTAIEHYSDARKAHGDAIADMALHNFIEMRDKVGSRMFRLGKRLEKLLHRLFPAWFTPLYHMVTFSTIPYADAQKRARLQWRVITGILILLTLLIASGITVLLLRM